MNNEAYYKTNKIYSEFLARSKKDDYQKYIVMVNKFLLEGGSFLDVGCGPGIALSGMNKNIHTMGVEVSEPSVEMCLGKGLSARVYDGKHLPFEDASFDCVGSYNVLEHVDEPIEFLEEQLRVLKENGYLFVVCPNFLSITNSYHYHTRGIFQKVKNIFGILIRIIFKKLYFQKMQTIQADVFSPDDDACNVTNPVDIKRWAKTNHLSLCYWSASSVFNNGIASKLDFSIMKYFLGSSFLVFQKDENKK